MHILGIAAVYVIVSTLQSFSLNFISASVYEITHSGAIATSFFFSASFFRH
jgi:hypothetical protein